jgi:hypothetical protein
MNEIRRAGLEQIAAMLRSTMVQVEVMLEAERNDIKELPDDIEASDFAERVMRRPMFELAQARIHLLETVEHIGSAIKKEPTHA